MNKKILVAVVSLALLLCVAVGGTIAYLTATTSEVKNTFSPSNIGITLQEHGAILDAGKQGYTLTNSLLPNGENVGNEYKIIPGVNLPKDPFVTVAEGSEPCWVFIKIETTSGTDAAWSNLVTYEVDSVWTVLNATDHPGVYYYEFTDVVAAGENAANVLNILTDKEIKVSSDITSTTMINGDYEMKITAYAIQHATFNTAVDAWTEVSKP